MPPSCLSRSVLLPLPAGTAASSHTGAGSPVSTAYVNGAIIVITCRRSQSGTEKFGKLPNIEQHVGGGVWILENKPPSLPGWTDKHCPPPPPSAISSRMSPLDIGSPETQCQCPGLPCYGPESGRAGPRGGLRTAVSRAAHQGNSRGALPRDPAPTYSADALPNSKCSGAWQRQTHRASGRLDAQPASPSRAEVRLHSGTSTAFVREGRTQSI